MIYLGGVRLYKCCSRDETDSGRSSNNNNNNNNSPRTGKKTTVGSNPRHHGISRGRHLFSLNSIPSFLLLFLSLLPLHLDRLLSIIHYLIVISKLISTPPLYLLNSVDHLQLSHRNDSRQVAQDPYRCAPPGVSPLLFVRQSSTSFCAVSTALFLWLES